VDEVLAVGDAGFQKKCLGKMGEVQKGEGRTILFVSHNMAAVKTLCHRGIVLENGLMKFNGDATGAVTCYLKGDHETNNFKLFGDDYENDLFRLKEISLHPKNETNETPLNEYQEIELDTKIFIKSMPERLHVTFVLNSEQGEPIFTVSHIQSGVHLQPGDNHLVCTLPKGFLNIGSYYLSLYVIRDARDTVFVEKDIMSFDVQTGGRHLGSWMGREPGFIKPVFHWNNITAQVDNEKKVTQNT
jgi:lipopolysaccharide transport system ATP-binding protein